MSTNNSAGLTLTSRMTFVSSQGLYMARVTQLSRIISVDTIPNHVEEEVKVITHWMRDHIHSYNSSTKEDYILEEPKGINDGRFSTVS